MFSSDPAARMFVSCLAFHRVDDQVVAPRVDTYHHPFVHLVTGTDIEPASLLKIEQGVAERAAAAVGYQHAITTLGDVGCGERRVVREGVVKAKPVPEVAVRKSVRSPIRPRAGIT